MRLVSSGCLTVYPLGRWSSVVGLGLSCGWNFSTISAAATVRNPLRCKGSASFRYTDVIAYQSADSHLPGRQDYVTAKRPSPWRSSAVPQVPELQSDLAHLLGDAHGHVGI